MSKSTLTAVRRRESLILNNEPRVFVHEHVVQYLMNHQVHGVRFLYQNYKHNKSCILNDESGLGKCFQCIALLDAILTTERHSPIIIICARKQNVHHWQSSIRNHIDKKINCTIVDNDEKGRAVFSLNSISIVSVDNVLLSLSSYVNHDFDCVVVQDELCELTATNFDKLSQIKAKCKIVLCSNDLTNEITYFYEALKFCKQLGVLSSVSDSSQTLNLNVFKQRFDCDDNKSTSKRSKILRKKHLINACSEFYMRRQREQFATPFPLIKPDDTQMNLCKGSRCDSEPCHMPASESLQQLPDQLPLDESPDEVPASQDYEDNNEVNILNEATDFIDFDSLMSPLVYVGSEGSINDGDDEDSEGRFDSQNCSVSQKSPEIACNQEHAANLTKVYKRNIPRNKLTNERISDCFENIHNHSDVEIVLHSSPDVISISSASQYDPASQTHTAERSPDLFDSFRSVRSEAVTPSQAIRRTSIPNTADTIRHVFGEQDECDDIDLLSNTNTDIFEITKNNVFDNVLCSNGDRITPAKSKERTELTATSSCLTGLRVILPKLNSELIQQIKNDMAMQSQAETPVVTQLVANGDEVEVVEVESESILVISSEHSSRDIEKTPERRQELTPSTRSCLKRHSSDRNSSERGKKSPYTRHGWLSKTRTSPRTDTPRSRQRVEKWRRRTNDNNMKPEDYPSTSKPRNLCKEFNPSSQRSTRKIVPDSPNLFSDHE